jgi:hypothetical protein
MLEHDEELKIHVQVHSMKTSSAQFLPPTQGPVPANRSGRVEFGALVALTLPDISLL